MKSALLASALLAASASVASGAGEPIATYSIVAHDPVAEEWGVAVQSRFLAVGAVVPYAKAGVGAAASQAWGDPNLGLRALDLMAGGDAADSALKHVLAPDSNREHRQVGMVDTEGRAATFTGRNCQPWAGGMTGDDYCVQGNILAGDSVVIGMARAFESTSGPLAHRLISALAGGQRYGGDKRGMQSAALLVVSQGGGYSGFNDRMVDLRVDDHPDPIAELDRLLALHERTFGGEACLRIGLAARREGKHAKAELALSRAMGIAEKYGDDPNLLNAVAWELAINDYRLGDALRMAEKAASLSPRDANVLDTWAECHARMGNFRMAVDLEKKAYKLSKDPEFARKLREWKKRAAR
jgi:uncharacterized Ntn-hydrolase superfamily protein